MGDRSVRSERLSSAQRALLDRLTKGQSAGSGPVIPRAPGDGPFPLSYAQDRVWFTSQLAPDVRLFNLMGGIRLPGTIGAGELELRLATAVQRHDVLRMSVQLVDDEPRLAIAPSVPAVVTVLDRSSADPSTADALARQAVLDVAAAPYQLDRAPLWRLALVRLPAGEQMLVIGAHHLIMDGPSLPLLGRELLSPSRRPPPPIRYADFASWQKSLVASGGIAPELAYWRQRLAGLPPPLDLASGRQRPVKRSLRGATIAADVPGGVLQRIRGLSRHEGMTPYGIFLAGFVTLLHRYTGFDDVVVGASMSGRTSPGLYNMLGMFVNMVPIRISLAGQPSFRELLAQTKQTLAVALSKQNVPFELLVNDLRLGGARSHPPLVQVGFNMPMAEVSTEVRVVDLPFTSEGAQLDLTVHVQSRGANGLQLLFEYASDLFDERTVRCMIDHYLLLLEGLTADPARPVTEAPLMRPREREVLLAGGGPAANEPGSPPPSVTPHAAPPLAPLAALVAEQARRTPAQVAVVDGERIQTYAELERRANGIAEELRRLGTRTETLVGVFMRPGLDLAAALLAVWKAGAAFVPLDPGQPPARSGLILADTAAAVVLTQRELAGSLPDGDHRVVCTEDVRAVTGDVRPSPLKLANAAYVIYTSGSTGRPKGVVVTHGGIANRVMWTVRAHHIGAADRVLQKTRLTFDAAVWEIFAPLISGGSVVMAPPGADRDPAALLRAVADHQVTVLQVVPSVLRLLAEAGDWSGCRRLRLLFSAGEPLRGDLCARVQKLTEAEIVNTYGPTECAIDVASARYLAGYGGGPVPIGRPIDNTRLLVADPAVEPVPVGVPGELYVGGAGVGRGYLGRPDLTAAAFVPDPHGPPGGRLYRTGDLVRWRPDGELEFLGRRDHQVKVNGVRVELGEIEFALLGYPGVRGAVVTAPQDGSGARSLVAYVAGDVAHAELRTFLRERLPSSMIPGLFVSLDAIPLAANGKVDRAALPAPDRDARPDGTAYLPPRNGTEETISLLWSDLLEVGPVGVRDDFFALGGHSLLLTRLAARLRGTLGANLTVADLFSAPTVEEQARLVTTSRASSMEPIRPVDRSGPLPLSPGQNRLWFLQQLDPQDASYNVPMILRLTGELDVTALQAALDDVVARHEVLRSTISAGADGAGAQVIHPRAPVRLALTVLTGLPGDEPRARVRSLLDAAASRPFDLAEAPMLRAQLIRLGPAEHVLGITFHHIASDGWSAGIFRRELSALYAAHHSGQPSGLAPLPIQYADYAAWQHRHLTGELVQRQLDYWRTQLAGLPTVALPTDYPRPARVSPAAAYCTFDIPTDIAGKLRLLGRRAGTSLFMTLLAGFQTLLSRYTGQDDVIVGTTVAGRGHPETEQLIGFFVNTLVLRTDLSGNPTVTQLLARVREMALGAYTHQDLPFERLVEELQPPRDLSRHPLFQIMFEMITDEADEPLAGLVTAPLWEETLARAAKFDLTIAVGQQADGSLRGYVEYAADLFGQSAIQRMLAHFVMILTEFGDDPGRRLSDIRMMSQAEREQLTAWATGPAISPAVSQMVPDIVAAQAQATPGAVAVIADGRRMTYRELNTRADQLAQHLTALGAGPETVVGLCLDDGVAFIVAALAVLKAGGAYLPLDPDHPSERLGFMLSNAAAAIIVTTTGLRGRIPAGAAVSVLAMDGTAVPAAAVEPPPGAPRARPHPDNTAYVIYTSGSTGSPKAVMVGHRAFASSTVARRRYYRDPVGTLFLLSPVIFDSSVAGIFWTLCSGGTLLLAPRGRKLADEISLDIAAYGVTHLIAVPSLLGQVADWHGHRSREPLNSLRVVITAGEACPADLAARLSTVAPGAKLFNEYGPTEAGIWATAARLGPAEGSTPPIGTPIPNAVCHVLDAQLRPVPVGVPGEIYLGGTGLARGYAALPALTSERFVASPLSRDGARLYRTGDLARWRPDGQLEFLGRMDSQVKMAGYRIEPAEIEAALMEHPHIATAVVTAPADQSAAPGLVAYLVAADPDRRATAEELRAFCQIRLPEYLIPAAFVYIAAVPLTATGKTDRSALSRYSLCDTEQDRAQPKDAGGDSPRTEVERQVAGIWCDVLGRDRVGMHDDFFELGGNSLQAVRISTRLQELYDVELPLRRLFEATTVAELAAALESAIKAEVAALPDAEVEAILMGHEPQ